MSEDAEPSPEFQENPAVDRDFLLQLLASMVNTNGTEFPLTLSINGMLVTGKLIGIEDYFSLMADALSDSIFGDDNSEHKASFRAQTIGLCPSKAALEEPPSAKKINFIHLKETKVFNAAGQSMNISTSLVWRGRISEVKGWSCGRFSAED